MDLWTLSQILLCVGEEVVRTCADEIGSANLGVCEGELGGAGGGLVAHELLEQLSLLGGHDCWSRTWACSYLFKGVMRELAAESRSGGGEMELNF